jgi:hypothetical protein
LAGWDFPTQIDRGSLACEFLEDATRKALVRLKARGPYQMESPVCVEETHSLSDQLASRSEAVAASGEFDGLNWHLAVVDLRKLIAFQRQIRFTSYDRQQYEPMSNWQRLLDFGLPVKRALPHYSVTTASDGKSLTIRSECPNLSVRFAHGADHSLDSVQLVAHSGSPYCEVASYRGRWFLRDGYHRSFLLLQQGKYKMPAVVVKAETLAELGAIGYRFFSEETLFSGRPPMVSDFLDDEMVACFSGPMQEKYMKISIQEQLQSAQAESREGMQR